VELPSVLEGIEARFVDTERIKMHVHFNKNHDATPIMFIHGNLSGATFFEEVMVDLSDQFACFAPDLRGYGQTEDKSSMLPEECVIGLMICRLFWTP